MPAHVGLLNRAMIVGQIQVGTKQRYIAVCFGISQSAVSKLSKKFNNTNEVKDKPRSGRPKITSQREDQYIEANAGRNRRVTGEILLLSLTSSQFVETVTF